MRFCGAEAARPSARARDPATRAGGSPLRRRPLTLASAPPQATRPPRSWRRRPASPHRPRSARAASCASWPGRTPGRPWQVGALACGRGLARAGGPVVPQGRGSLYALVSGWRHAGRPRALPVPAAAACAWGLACSCMNAPSRLSTEAYASSAVPGQLAAPEAVLCCLRRRQQRVRLL